MQGRETEALSVRESKAEKREREHEKDLERLKLLRPMDDDFMRGMLKDDMPLAEFMVRIILDKPDFRFIRFETQADLKQVTGARSVIFDGLGTEDSGRKIDLEVQREDKGAEPERARYHSSVLDVENLKKGQDFSELPDTCVIFITEKDFYAEGKSIYHIERMNVTRGLPFNDRSMILYVNGEYDGDDDLGDVEAHLGSVSLDDLHGKLLLTVSARTPGGRRGKSPIDIIHYILCRCKREKPKCRRSAAKKRRCFLCKSPNVHKI